MIDRPGLRDTDARVGPFVGDSEMAARMRATDWSTTGFGPVDTWPQSLKTMLGVVLGSRFPMLLWWGPDLLHLYNDACRPILRDKHPASLAAPAAQVWAEVWDVAGPMARGVLEGAPATGSEELPLLVRSGEMVAETCFTFSYSPVPGDDGRVGGVLNIVQETTPKAQGERQIRMLHDLAALDQRLAEPVDGAQRRAWVVELERANRELDAFSYAVSHDLRAPLRAIDGFSQALVEDCGEQLDALGHQYLDRIRGGVGRMAGLIDALLGLARVGRVELRRERVDLSRMARDVVAELRRAQPERQVEAEIADGLVAEGDGSLLRMVLANLLGNAWKFTACRGDARVTVGCDGDGEPAFFVRDNGAGFDQAYVDRLFTPFQRLHGQAEFEGVGAGLATVQRVIHRHGGRVWAEGAVGEGATFHFTLPAGGR